MTGRYIVSEAFEKSGAGRKFSLGHGQAAETESVDISALMTTFIDDCDERIQNFIYGKKTELTEDAAFFMKTHTTEPSLSYAPDHDIKLVFEPLLTLARGGKRTRARLVFLGFFSIKDSITSEEYNVLLDVACAVEIFQLAALIHDDIIDGSDTRRGAKAAHVVYKDHCAARGSDPEPAAVFGRNAAIILGDTALALANEIYISSADALSPPMLPLFYQSNRLFLTMHSQVMLGQFLDILGESTAIDTSSLSRAHLIATLKSALYSVVYPLQLGALLSGADRRHLDSLQSYGLPLGQAFQLRDDALGIFGDQGITGKPRGDDIREGKQTVLMSYAFDLLNDADKPFLKNTLGNPEASFADILTLTKLIKESGALDKLEDTIAELFFLSSRHMPPFVPMETQKLLAELGSAIVHRNT